MHAAHTQHARPSHRCTAAACPQQTVAHAKTPWLWPGQLAAMQRHSRQWRRAALPRDLWSYEATCVQELNLDTLKALHRLSYGHRGRRSMLVVVYDPEDSACRDAETEVERLATGLRHYPHVVVAKINVRTAHLAPGQKDKGHNKDPAHTAQYLASLTDMSHLPVVLLYPEGAPGMMRYNVPGPLIAESILAALNSAQTTVFPDRPQMQLARVRTGNTPEQAPDSTPSSLTAGSKTAASVASASTAGGNTWTKPNSYWSPEKAWFWGGIAIVSVALLVWEKWLGPLVEMRAFRKRQAMRAADPDRAAELFDEDINIEDLWRLKTLTQGNGSGSIRGDDGGDDSRSSTHGLGTGSDIHGPNGTAADNTETLVHRAEEGSAKPTSGGRIGAMPVTVDTHPAVKPV